MLTILILIIIIALLLAGGVYGWWWLFKSALPLKTGTLSFTELDAPVTIGFDSHGVPNITAASMHDGAFTMGFLHGQDRLWQLELARRVAGGRLSEFAGTATVEADRFLRRVGLRRLAEEEWTSTNGDAKVMLEAYAAGVNAARRTARRLPLEFRLLRGLEPEPWTPVDSLAIVKLLGLSLSLNWDVEKQRLDVLQLLGPEKAAELDVLYPEANPTILQDTVRHLSGAKLKNARNLFQEADRWLNFGKGGSNSWVLAGGRTESGSPLLCNDPHLLPSVPSQWYGAHIQVEKDFESTGVTFPGMPFTLIGHNRNCAWGYTNSFADAQDLVVEEFDGPGYRRYRTEKGARPSKIIREIIRVRDSSDVVEDVIVTRHGPVVERIDASDRGSWKGLALQWTANPPGRNAEAMLRTQRAKDWESFRQAHAFLDAPSQNVVYADTEGHIGYFTCGRIPVRKRRPSGLPVPGWTGDALWERFLSDAEVPQLFDPPEECIITANNQIVGDGFPKYIGNDYMNGYRAKRIASLLDRRYLTAQDMKELQLDIISLPAQESIRLLRGLTCSGNAETVRQKLIAWDGAMDPGKEEPALFECFLRRLHEHALVPFCGDAWTAVAGFSLTHPVFGYPGNTIGRFTPYLLSLWASDDTKLFQGVTSWSQVVEHALGDAATDHQSLAKRVHSKKWGRIHHLTLLHPFGERWFLRLIFNVGPVPMPGSTDTVAASAFNPREPFATTMWAPSWRQILDPGNWDLSSGIHYPGQSGQPGSRHYRDLMKRWLRNEQLPLPWTTTNVQAAIKSTLILTPDTV